MSHLKPFELDKIGEYLICHGFLISLVVFCFRLSEERSKSKKKRFQMFFLMKSFQELCANFDGISQLITKATGSNNLFRKKNISLKAIRYEMK